MPKNNEEDQNLKPKVYNLIDEYMAILRKNKAVGAETQSFDDFFKSRAEEIVDKEDEQA